MEIIKNSCGQHSLTSMSLMLNMDMMTIRYNINKEGLTFDGTQVECELCELKLSNDSINQDLVFQFMKYDVSIHFVQHSIFYLFLAYLNMFLLSFEMYSYIFIHLNLFQDRLVTLRTRIPIIDVKMGRLLKLKNKLYRVS